MRCERVTRLHVPVLKELWLSDEPKRNVCIFVTVECDILKRRTMVHFRYTCTCRSDWAKSGNSELRWSISSRFVYIHFYTRMHCQYLTEIKYHYFLSTYLFAVRNQYRIRSAVIASFAG